MKYALVTVISDSTKFVNLVGEAIDAGWRPIGGVSIATAGETTEPNKVTVKVIYAQAMIKDQ
jgi:hypothetical protein